jgi:NADP-dependent 3-hydroxy acid dehydrogenase YdfG
VVDYVTGKSIVITGAGSGFGRLVAEKAAARGALITCADINLTAAEAVASAIRESGGEAQAVLADVRDMPQIRALAAAAVAAYGRIDVMINNAGIMPLAFFSDHEAAYDAWDRCIDINIKGVMNGMVAVYDQMIAQGQGQIINLSSIYGNHPTIGGGVYGATKSAVNFLSESLRIEARGKIKVTVVKPTGVLTTGLGETVINPAAGIGSVGFNMAEFGAMAAQQAEGTLDPSLTDADKIAYISLGAGYIADAILHAIDQPWGVSVGDITVRAAGDHFVI